MHFVVEKIAFRARSVTVLWGQQIQRCAPHLQWRSSRHKSNSILCVGIYRRQVPETKLVDPNENGLYIYPTTSRPSILRDLVCTSKRQLHGKLLLKHFGSGIVNKDFGPHIVCTVRVLYAVVSSRNARNKKWKDWSGEITRQLSKLPWRDW